MLLPFVPELFTCTACGERWPADVLCGGTFQTREQAWCVQCCGCFMHRPGRDPGGTAVFVVQTGHLRWRGLAP